MNLFNEFENKNIPFLLNYINQLTLGEIDALTADEIRNLLSGENGQLTSPELVDAILNQTESISESLCLLMDDGSGKMVPTLSYDPLLPILITGVERAWLKYILEDPKSNLFMLPWAKKKMEIALSDYDSPIKNEYIDIRGIPSEQNVYSDEYIHIFKELVFNIKNKKHISLLTTHNDKSLCILPYRLIFHPENNQFSLLGYDTELSDIVTIDLNDIKSVTNNSKGRFNPDDYAVTDYDSLFSNCLKKHEAAPIKVEVINSRFSCRKELLTKTASDDRFSHLFANYNTINYRNDLGNLISEINYYDFQYEDVLNKLLMLGKYVKVLEPEDIKNQIIQIIKRKINRQSE